MAEDNRASSRWHCFQVLVTPGKVFPALVEAPAFVKPALAVSGGNLFLGAVLVPRVQAFTVWALKHGPVTLPPEQMEQALVVAPKAAAVGSVAVAVLAPWFLWLVVAGVLKLYALLSAREAPFRPLFAVAVYGYLPVFLGGLITTALLLGVPVENFERVSLSLAAFMPYQKSFLYFFLTKCSPFTWWSLFLWGSGGAAVLKTRPAGVTAYLFGLWLVEALVSAAVAGLKAPAGLG